MTDTRFFKCTHSYYKLYSLFFVFIVLLLKIIISQIVPFEDIFIFQNISSIQTKVRYKQQKPVLSFFCGTPWRISCVLGICWFHICVTSALPYQIGVAYCETLDKALRALDFWYHFVELITRKSTIVLACSWSLVLK